MPGFRQHSFDWSEDFWPAAHITWGSALAVAILYRVFAELRVRRYQAITWPVHAAHAAVSLAFAAGAIVLAGASAQGHGETCSDAEWAYAVDWAVKACAPVMWLLPDWIAARLAARFRPANPSRCFLARAAADVGILVWLAFLVASARWAGVHGTVVVGLVIFFFPRYRRQ